jgi:meso-butanediol dehydrogenase / (S,S)-butanediol dehydrogenase / diacetyl reductase
MADRFHGKVVIVTGAASGIGEATARRFAAEGAMVAVVDRNKDALETVAKSLPADRTMAPAADVSNSSAVDGMVATVVERFALAVMPDHFQKVAATTTKTEQMAAGSRCKIS